MTAARATLLIGLLVAVAVTAPLAFAQTLSPRGIGPYEDAYVVYGRVVDVNHRPAYGASFLIEFQDELNGKMRSSSITGFSTNRGEIQGDFRIGEVTPHGKVTLSIGDKSVSANLDPELRRTDLELVLDKDYFPEGFEVDNGTWPGLYSVRIRAVNLTEGYPAPRGGNLFGEPLREGRVTMVLTPENGNPVPLPYVGKTAEQGDFNYTFRLDKALPPGGGTLSVTVNDVTKNVSLDMATRYSFVPFKFGDSHLPEYTPAKTPLPAMVSVLALAGAAALLVLRRRSG